MDPSLQLMAAVLSALFDWTAVLLFLAAGVLISFLAGKLKEAQRRERDALDTNRRLSLAVAAARAGVWEYDVATGVNRWEQGMADVFGVPPEKAEESGRDWLSFIHPEDREMVEGDFRRMLEQQVETSSLQFRALHCDGSVKWLLSHAASIENKAGRKIVGFALDITAHKRIEEALKRAKELAEAVSRISEILHSMLPPDEVIRHIINEGVAALGSDTAAISERESGSWVVRFVHGMPAEFVGRRMDDGKERHAVLALESREPVSVDDAFNDERFNREHLRNYNVRSVLVVPLIIRGEPFGVIFLNYHKGQHLFTKAEMIFARQLATAASSALGNARLSEQRARAEEEMRSLALFPQENPAPVLRVDDEGRLLFANPASAPLLQQWECAVGGRVPDTVCTAARRGLETGNTEEVEANIGEQTVSFVLTPIKERRYVNLYGRDMTERKRAERALQEAQSRLRAVLDATGVGLWFNKMPFGVLTWDRATRELFFVPPEMEPTGELFWSRLHPDDREPTRLAVETAVREGSLYAIDHRTVEPETGRVRWIHSEGRGVYDQSGRLIRFDGVNYDVTQRKAFQEELERVVEERTARLKELVNELEHFSYTITHDMRAPLRAMRGFAEVLNETNGEWSDEDRQKFLQRIIVAAERMDALITDALHYSKMVRLELPMAPVDVGRLLRGMLETYPQFQVHNADISVQEDLPLVMGNEAGLTQCFSNLIGNAVKFAKPGEKAVVRVRSEVVAENQRSGWVRLCVEDKGVGISEAMKPRIFNMFSRGSHPEAGTGIGLALVRKVVDRMGGRVGVESQEGLGSRFWVELRRG